jgi:hypothetical protein
MARPNNLSAEATAFPKWNGSLKDGIGIHYCISQLALPNEAELALKLERLEHFSSFCRRRINVAGPGISDSEFRS